MLRLASSRPRGMSPAWIVIAPQQPWSRGTITSTPAAFSTRTVASCQLANATCMMEPACRNAVAAHRGGWEALAGGDEEAVRDARRHRFDVLHPERTQDPGAQNEAAQAA